ncbi:NAD(P)/FAD-dependent oxidoreductase [Gordonia sp. NPDC003376]
MNATAVIAGAGIAGMTAAETLRANGFPGEITVIGSEPGLPYRRTALSKDLMRADLSADRIALRTQSQWADRQITLRTGLTVEHIDPDRRVVLLDDGTTLHCDVLILATGGAANTTGGDDAAMTLRTRADAERIRAAIADRGALRVIGAGLIGLELAASAAAAGYPVDVHERADRVMERVVPEPVSAMLAELHCDNGVRLHRDNGVRLHRDTDIPAASAAPALVEALGIRPDVRAAETAGIAVTGAGILVDDRLRAGIDGGCATGIYAAGDVAAPPHPLTGEPTRTDNWMAATEQGRAAALSAIADLDGLPAPAYTGVPLAFTVQYGTNLQIVGWPGGSGPDRRIEVDGDLRAHDATVRVFTGSTLIGGVTVGRPREGRALQQEIASVTSSA